MKTDNYNSLIQKATSRALETIKGHAHKAELVIKRDCWNTYFKTGAIYNKELGEMQSLPMICVSTIGISHKAGNQTKWETDISKEELELLTEEQLEVKINEVFSLWNI